MAYVAVKGGQIAIEASIEKLKHARLRAQRVLNVDDIAAGMRGLIDQVMSEASLYDEDLAALAIKQAEGNPEEVVFLLRAYRSTLPRLYYSKMVQSDEMRLERRISASFKDIVGGQMLGASYDYTHRLIDFELLTETDQMAKEWCQAYLQTQPKASQQTTEFITAPKVIDYLRKEGIADQQQVSSQPPIDMTQKSLTFPTQRSERLQLLTRGQTGAVTALGYASLRGFGSVHPTVGELRVGHLPLYIDSAHLEGDNDTSNYYIGQIKITEVESLIPITTKAPDGNKQLHFDIGYGICYGQNETKAIAMSILDSCLQSPSNVPTHDEEFVLYHIDSVEATGFISHLKLPHYVTFQSELDSVRKTREDKA